MSKMSPFWSRGVSATEFFVGTEYMLLDVLPTNAHRGHIGTVPVITSAACQAANQWFAWQAKVGAPPTVPNIP